MPSFAIRLRTTDPAAFTRATVALGLRSIGPAKDGIVETRAGAQTISDEFIVIAEGTTPDEAIARLRDAGAAFELMGDPERLDN
jgi:hypothetical protein